MTKSEMITEIRQLIQSSNGIKIGKALAEQMNGYSRIVIYGAGNVGQNCANFMRIKGYKIERFLDRNASSDSMFLDCPVYSPDDSRLDAGFRKDSLIVVSLVMDENGYIELKNKLRDLGYSHFVNAFYQLGLSQDYGNFETNEINIFNHEKESILDAFGLMADVHSQNVYLSIFRAHATFNYRLTAQSPGMEEYFDVDVPFRHKYRFFIDCGAYTGDSLKSLLNRHKVDYYCGFEPDPKNYAKLLQTASEFRSKAKHFTLLPLGVSDKNQFLKFFAAGGSGSRIDEAGDHIIHTVSLDDLFIGYNSLMIKMDVEGAEIAALNGSKRIITEIKPDLAICVYHNVYDLWRIPLLISEWAPEYRFYLRNHDIGTLGTVMYATVNG